jgi:CRP-like cAMP-binding protein
LGNKIYSRRSIPAGKVIVREGDPAPYGYLLKSGRVEISTLKDNKHVVLNTIVANQIFGELALIDGSPRSATAKALEDCEVLIVTQDDLRRQLDGLDDFMKYWVGHLTDQIRKLSKRVSD